MEMLITPFRERGLQALREGDLDAAVDLLTQAAQEDPQDAEAQAYLGVASSQKGLHGEAARALQSAIRLRPQEARFHHNLGVALEMAGDPAAAMKALRRAVQVNPSYSPAREKLRELTDQHPDLGRSRPGAAAVANPHLAPWLQPGYTNPADPSGSEITAQDSRPAMGTGDAFARRFAAMLIDELIVTCLGFIVGLGVGFVIGFAAGVAGGGRDSPAVGALIYLACLIASVIVEGTYFGVMHSACGQTLGKMALGLRVVGPDGKNPGLWWAVLRGVGRYISGIVFCLGFFWMLWDPEQQTWHDKMAGTRVVRA